jgi:hypothetical protein
MPIPATLELPPPRSDDEFDEIVGDVLRHRHGTPHLVRFGRSGQNQHGIDGLDPTVRPDEAVVWQSTLREDDIVGKIQRDLTRMDGELGFQPRLFVVALGTTRDKTIQLALHRISVARLEGGKCPIEALFWEDIRNILCFENRLLRKWYPASCAPERSPDVALIWVKADKQSARIEDGALELPGTDLSLAHTLSKLDREIAGCDQVLSEPRFSEYPAKVSLYRTECIAFRQHMEGEEAFRAWFIEKHWDEVRWFSVGIENNGDSPATGIDIRLKPPEWLCLFKERPTYQGGSVSRKAQP